MSFKTTDVERGTCEKGTSVIGAVNKDTALATDKRKGFSGYKILVLLAVLGISVAVATFLFLNREDPTMSDEKPSASDNITEESSNKESSSVDEKRGSSEPKEFSVPDNKKDFLSALHENSDDELVEVINRENFKVDVLIRVDMVDRPPLHLVMRRYGFPKSFKALLEKKANVNLQDAHGWTPLIYSVLFKNLDVTNALLEKGANIDGKDADGTTALIHAVMDGKVYLVNLLLDAGANVDVQDADGKTALIFAVMAKNVDLITLLLEKKAKVDLKDNGENTALDYANALRFSELKEILSKPGSSE